MDTSIKLAKKRGPKPSAVKNVVYYRRVHPDVVARLDAVLLPPDDGSMMVKDRIEAEEVVVAAIKEDGREFKEVYRQLEAMTRDYQAEYEKSERLQLELVAANQDYDRAMSQTEDDKVRYWRDRAFRAEAANKSKGGEYDQTQS